MLDNNIRAGGTGGSGGSGNGLGGQGGFGQGPVFNSNHYNMSTLELQIEAAMRILHEAAANEASHDSGESYGRPPCHQDTRREYLSHLHAWSYATEDSKPFWMCGPAGTGKSAIAQSFCKQLHARDSLGGGFFFKRDHPTRGNAQKLFPTLAYQLATVCPPFKAALAPRVANDPALVGKSLSTQLQKLILEPYHDSASDHPFVMVIDGLDECDGEYLQQQIMRCAMDAHSVFGLRFLVVSRPESHLHAAVAPTSFDQLVIEGSYRDIKRYLVDEFERIRTTHDAMLGIIGPWPDYKFINTLVEKSSGHFIYAATAIRFIGDEDWNPIERLGIVMGVGEPDADSNSPFTALDQLYIEILKAVPGQSRLQRILAVASAMEEQKRGDYRFSVDDIAQILHITTTNVRLTLRRLRSLIWLPETDGEGELFIWHHASFPDFLNSPERAGEFYFNDIARSSLAVSVIKVFCDSRRLTPTYDSERHITGWMLKLNFITTTKLSSDMAKNLDCVNLDLIFNYCQCVGGREETEEVLNWLKLHGAPRTLIQHWEDIVYMAKFDIYLRNYPPVDTPDEMQLDELQHINGVSPGLLDIIQAYVLLEFIPNPLTYCLAYIRWVLDVSWQQIMAPIATTLRSAGETPHLDNINKTTANLIRGVIKSNRIRQLYCEATMEVIAKRIFLILTHEPWVLRFIKSWSCILRSCPHTEDLLDTLRLLVMGTDYCNSGNTGRDIYHIRTWLKSHPSSPLDMLEKLGAIEIPTARQEEYEAHWMEWRQRTGIFTTSINE
ncbi:hypothetical protein R3P38DRAFT_3264067 [Favolaschia claudopus]|uniref:Nephrocystin 3-like N-terminal domain-containing protein n=1 Tax=Favolaschia claudopus TaxID=2862362 RepID=A0AAW0C413_9AGAR